MDPTRSSKYHPSTHLASVGRGLCVGVGVGGGGTRGSGVASGSVQGLVYM